ncbi:sulfatase [Paraglaciecola sp. L3A3]|uniref:sulfatase family protein n=1 Tax=Paraglaciecola sp. L3A3 TaxID=2686358 RepID=UPI00131ECC7B|nr:sulfatase-like hydrolase/transferase [Paraglaciecola sp. L3A3]
MYSNLKTKLQAIAIVTAVGLISGCSHQATKSAITDSSKLPNIVFIIADDQGYADLGYKQLVADVDTPNIDKIAQKGIDFTQAYVSSPICSTSRTSLITGSYAQRMGMFWYGGKGLENPTFTTLPEMLKTANYTTGYVGKFHYGNSKLVPNRNFPLNHGVDYFYGFEGGRKHYLIHDNEQKKSFVDKQKKSKQGGESLEMGSVWINDKKVKQTGFSTELIEQHATQFIDNNKNKPFYLQVAFNALHNFTHQLPEEYLKQHNLPKMADWDPTTESFRDWYVAGRVPNNDYGRDYYLGQLHYLDKAVGSILTSLETNNLADNTIVIYISDNGGSTPIYANNGIYRGSKYTLYEGGIRVPMVIYMPDALRKGLKNGQSIDNVVSIMDIYPTILQAAGIDIPAHIDGMPLNNMLLENKPLVRDALVWDTGHEIAVRKGKWKYHAVYDDFYAVKQMVELTKGEFLYDIDADPTESKNLIDQYPEIVESLRQVHLQWASHNDQQPKRIIKRK